MLSNMKAAEFSSKTTMWKLRFCHHHQLHKKEEDRKPFFLLLFCSTRMRTVALLYCVDKLSMGLSSLFVAKNGVVRYYIEAQTKNTVP